MDWCLQGSWFFPTVYHKCCRQSAMQEGGSATANERDEEQVAFSLAQSPLIFLSGQRVILITSGVTPVIQLFESSFRQSGGWNDQITSRPLHVRRWGNLSLSCWCTFYTIVPQPTVLSAGWESRRGKTDNALQQTYFPSSPFKFSVLSVSVIFLLSTSKVHIILIQM